MSVYANSCDASETAAVFPEWGLLFLPFLTISVIRLSQSSGILTRSGKHTLPLLNGQECLEATHKRDRVFTLDKADVPDSPPAGKRALLPAG